MKRIFLILMLSGIMSVAVLVAQKGNAGPVPKPEAPAAANPPETALEYEEVWLKVGVVFNYPSATAPAVIFPTDKKFLPNAKTPLRIRGPKAGKVAVRVDGQPLHTQYKVKPRKGERWSYRPEKGDYVERMIRRPKPKQPEPEIVAVVETTDKEELGDDWNSAEIETVKDNTAIAAQVKETEAKSEEYRKPFHDRLFGVRATYINNYTEHYAQYYTLPTSGVLMHTDVYGSKFGRAYFEYLAAGTSSDLPSGSTYVNPNFWRLGFRGHHFGGFFKSQANKNPVGQMLRDRLSSEIGVTADYGFDVFNMARLTLGSNLGLLWYEKPQTSTISSGTDVGSGLLFNVTADLSVPLLHSGGFYDIYARAGTAFSVLDSTNTGYDAAGTWNSQNRNMVFSGARFGLSGHLYLIDSFRLTATADYYPFMASGYKRFTNLTRETASSMFVFQVGGEFRM